MTPPLVLIVEDNDITRKFVRVTLSGAGYRVQDCGDGACAIAKVGQQRPDLVVLDIGLPDMDGFELVERLRKAGCVDVPIIAASGYLAESDVARMARAAFDDLLVKPIEPERLLRAVQAWLPRTEGAGVGRPYRVLLADDDPVQLKLGRALLVDAGFQVETVRDGAEALARVQEARPDVVLSDVLMPQLDGFELCQTLRSRPDFADLPVVLLTSNYLEEADRQLAVQVGANALVVRTPDLAEAIQVVLESVQSKPPRPLLRPGEPMVQEHYRRVLHQLERQVTLNAELGRRAALQGAMLELVGSLSEALAGSNDVESAFRESLSTILDASGASKGALYTLEPTGELRLAAQVGFHEGTVGPQDAFGHTETLYEAVRARVTRMITAEGPQGSLLGLTRLGSALLVPLLASGESVGLLVLGSTRPDIEPDWQAFARAMGVQVGQALELQRAIAHVRASEARYRALVENIPGVVWTATLDGRLPFVSVHVETMTGLPAVEVKAGGVHAWTQRIHPEDRPNWVRMRDAMAEQGTPLDLEYRFRHLDGRWIWIHHRAVRSQGPGGTYDFEAVLSDVSGRKQLEAQLAQAQRMEAVGQLTAGIAHDFNNLLSVILANGSWLAEELPDADPRHDGAAELVQAAQKAADVTRQLLAFSRRQVFEPRVVDLGQLVLGMEKMVRRAVGESIDVRTAMGPGPVTVRVDRGQIEQVILNLVVNARDAMPQGGTLTLAAAQQTAQRSEHPELPSGPCAVLTVRDTGVGMDPATVSHIFEPFFTTKDRDKGTGLGLSTCWGIVRQSGGHILVDSHPGRGTTFEVWLPLVDEAPEQAIEPKRDAPMGRETVLLVEDDAAVRKVVARGLETYGYRILVAGSGPEAFAKAQQHAGPIDVLVTDVVMPGENGVQVADRLRELQPGLKVLFISGYVDHPQLRARLEQSGHAMLTKPFLPAALARAIRALVDGGPGS